MALTSGSRGYWLVTRAGKVEAFGDAHNYGSWRGSGTIVGIAATLNARGYWLVARDGRVEPFGNAEQVLVSRPV
jgi:hypothetical protein